LSDLLIIFSNNLLPILLAVSTGFIAAKYLNVTPRSISQVAFYIFSPCLVFNLLISSNLTSQDVTRMVGFTISVVLLIGILTALLGLALRLQRSILVAVLLTVMFGNAGNYGLSLNLFAFGEEALAHASLYFATTAILMYSVGVVIASLGGSNLRTALVGLLKVPTLYAVILALIFDHFHWQLALPVDRTVSLLADATIPVLMVLMGVQLFNSKLSNHAFAVGLSSLLRLVAAPALALFLVRLFHLQGAALQAGITQSAVPSAIITTILATEYDVEPALVTTIVFASTLLSPLTITPILYLLGAT
jgi:predicted permease